VDIWRSDTFLEKPQVSALPIGSQPWITTMEHGAGEWSISGSLGSFSGSVSCPTAVQKTEATPPVVYQMSKYVNAQVFKA